MQRGTFPLRGNTKEQVAYDWLKQIKKQMSYYEGLEKVIVDGEDITELVKDQEEKERLGLLD